MRNIITATVLMAVLAGCTGTTDPSQDQPGSDESYSKGESWSEKLSSTILPSAWSLSKTASGIDGDIITASRSFDFNEQGSHFIIGVTCTANTGVSGIFVQSFVGSVEEPSEDSRLLSAAVGSPITQPMALSTLSLMPQGRIKTNTGEVVGLSNYFRIDEKYGNYANYYWQNPTALRLAQKELGKDPSFFGVLPTGIINVSRLISDSLPMTLEVANGAGLFELEIDSANEIFTVLKSCGSEKPLIAESYMHEVQSRAAELEQQDTNSTPAPAPAPVSASASAAAAVLAELEAETQEPSLEQGLPSFNCKKAASFAEKLVCLDPVLAKLDSTLAENYKSMMDSDVGDQARYELKSTQRQWLKSRDSCAEAKCLESSYRDRIDEICGYTVDSDIHPNCTLSSEI